MAEVFHGGLHAGVHHAYEDATTGRHQRFREQMAFLANQRAGAGRRWQGTRQRLQALDQAEQIERRQAAADPRFGVDPRVTRQHIAHRNAVNAARLNEYGKFAAPELQQWDDAAGRTAGELHQGRRSFAQVVPGDLAAAIAHATNLDPRELQPGSEMVHAAEAVVRAAQSGDTAAALPAVNQLYRRVLAGHVGQHLHDGSVISRAPRIVGLHPNPRDPAQTTFAVQLTVTSPDGRVGTALRPLMLDSGHLSLHPDEAQKHAVLSVPTREFVHHTLALATAILAAQHPHIQAQLDAVPEAQRRRNRALLDLSLALGSKSPRRSVDFKPLGNGDIAIADADGLHRRVSLPPAQRASLEEQYRQALEQGDRDRVERVGRSLAAVKRGGVTQQHGVLQKQASAPADPYLKGRLYLGHDGRKARYLGGGKWGAP